MAEKEWYKGILSISEDIFLVKSSGDKDQEDDVSGVGTRTFTISRLKSASNHPNRHEMSFNWRAHQPLNWRKFGMKSKEIMDFEYQV